VPELTSRFDDVLAQLEAAPAGRRLAGNARS
jgi:hypothetical protein